MLELVTTPELLHRGCQLQPQCAYGDENRVHISIPVSLLNNVYAFAQPEHVRRGGDINPCWSQRRERGQFPGTVATEAGV